MITRNEGSMQIIILTEFSVNSSVMWFHFYRYIWQPKIEEILETRIDLKNEEDKYAVAVIDKESCIIVHLPKGT